MSHAQEILEAVAKIIKQKGERAVFTRNQVRKTIGLDRDEWLQGYTAIFQAMREDHPGRAPVIGEKYKGVFKRIAYGKYVLTQKGKKVLKGLGLI